MLPRRELDEGRGDVDLTHRLITNDSPAPARQTHQQGHHSLVAEPNVSATEIQPEQRSAEALPATSACTTSTDVPSSPFARTS